MPIPTSLVSKIAGIIFDRASTRWQLAIISELCAGVILVAPIIGHARRSLEIGCALVAIALMLVSRLLKTTVERNIELGNIIRRRGDFADGLGWGITAVALAEIKDKAGTETTQLAAVLKGAERAYETEAPIGPLRLCEMKLESAFWSKRINQQIERFFWWLTGLAVVAVLLPLALASSGVLEPETNAEVFYVTYILVPILISTDCFSWAIKARGLSRGSEEVFKELLAWRTAHPADEAALFKIVADYDCLMASAVPPPNWFFQRKRPRIQEEWNAEKLLAR